MIRILIVSQHFPPEKSGNASRIYDMAIYLSKLGANVIVFCPHPTFPTGNFKRIWKIRTLKRVNDVEVINVWTWQPTSRDPGFVSRIAYYILFPLHVLFWVLIYSRRFDVIITSAPPIFTGIPGLFSKIILRKKWIVDVRDLWIDASISLGFLKKGSIFERMSRKFEKICYSCADLVCVTTNELGKRLSVTYRINKKIVLIPNGVDTDSFYPCTRIKKNLLIYAGNVGHAQDLENVILAMKYVIKRHNVKLLIVGDGDVRDKLEKLTKSEGLDSVVIFTGLIPREKVPKMISESLIGLAPLKKLESLKYAVPTKAYEYMACGIPFIGCGNGEIVNLAKESGAGIIVDNDPKSIAEAIITLLDNPEKMAEMGELGRKYVKRNYDRKIIAHKLKRYIEMIL